MSKLEEEYVAVNGIQHFLLHYPKASDAPVLLYLHGGPGSIESLFAYRLDEAWGDLFTQVHWDQRGAGKTLSKNKKAGWPETIDQMLNDLHGIIGYLQRKYQRDKIILLGHSWGSVLGSLYVLRHPENVLAYIGTGQVISMMENERAAYLEVLEMARRAGNRKHIQALGQMGDYPPDDPELLLKKLPKVRKIQAACVKGPASGSGMESPLKMLLRSPSFQWVDIVSLIRVMKVNRSLDLQLLSFNLADYQPHYQIPVHYILGEADTIVPMSLGKSYYDTIDAPHKTITVIPGAGHNPMYERPDEFAAALRAVCETLQGKTCGC